MSLVQFPSRLLFSITADCPYVKEPWASSPADRPEALLPPLSELDGDAAFAQVHVAWNERGLYVAAEIPKQGPLVGNRQRPSSGDGMQLWIDTEPDATGGRANQHCYHFVILPQTPGHNRPVAWQQHIRRAHGRPPLCDPEAIQVEVQRGDESYWMRVGLPVGQCLDWAPESGSEVGFNYLIHDTAAGRQTWSCPPQAPYPNDPSYWGRLRLVR